MRKRYFGLLILYLFSFAIIGFTQTGVVIHQQNKVDNCYRLISSRNLEAAHLLASNGRYIHTWYFQHTDEQTSDFGGFGMTWHYAEMLPNGNLLAIIKDEMIIELDWNSNLLWKAKLRAHHDFARTQQGNTIVVSRRDVDNPWQKNKKIAMDELVEFDKSGKKVWNWQYENHLDEFKEFVKQPLPLDKSFKDWPHINTCEVLPENPTSQKDNRFKAGNLLLCGRHSNTIFIIEKESGDVVWAWGPGEIEGPHMPTMLENGHILIYDNGHHLKENSRGYTRVIELDPVKETIVWEYTGSPKESFFSPSRGSSNRLKKGNTLIAESDSGHLIEVTSDGEVVWEYWNTDFKNNGKRMPLYRTVPYDKAIVDPLLDRYGKVEDVLKKHKESLSFKEFGPNDQYKKIVREVVFFIEIGYYDLALQLLDKFMTVFPNDPEGYYGYSLLYAAKKNITLSFNNMQKAINKGMALERFTCGLTKIFDPLLNSNEFKNYIAQKDHLLIHGPMIGDVTAHSAMFWVRTFGQQSVQVIARQKGKIDFNIRSKKITSKTEDENTSDIHLDGLAPLTIYE